jgi:hypothetical protein
VQASPLGAVVPLQLQSPPGPVHVSLGPQTDVSQRHPEAATQSGAAAVEQASPVLAVVELHWQSLEPLQVSIGPHVVDASPQRQPVPAMQSGVLPVQASPTLAVVPLQLQSPPAPVQVSIGPHSDAWQRQPTPARQSGAVELELGHASPVPAVVSPHAQSPPTPVQVSIAPQVVEPSPQWQAPLMQSGATDAFGHASPLGAVVPPQAQSPPTPVHVSDGPQTDVSQRQPIAVTQSGAADAFGHASPLPATAPRQVQSPPTPVQPSFGPQIEVSQRQPVPATQSGAADAFGHASPAPAVVPLHAQSPPTPVQVSLGPQSDAWQRQPVPATQSGATDAFGQASPVLAVVPLQVQSPSTPVQPSLGPQFVDESPQWQAPPRQSGAGVPVVHGEPPAHVQVGGDGQVLPFVQSESALQPGEQVAPSQYVPDPEQSAPVDRSWVKSSTPLQSVSPPPHVSDGVTTGGEQVGIAGPVHWYESVTQMLSGPEAVQAHAPSHGFGVQTGSARHTKTPADVSSSTSSVAPSQSSSTPGVLHSSAVEYGHVVGLQNVPHACPTSVAPVAAEHASEGEQPSAPGPQMPGRPVVHGSLPTSVPQISSPSPLQSLSTSWFEHSSGWFVFIVGAFPTEQPGKALSEPSSQQSWPPPHASPAVTRKPSKSSAPVQMKQVSPSRSRSSGRTSGPVGAPQGRHTSLRPLHTLSSAHAPVGAASGRT